MLVSYLAYVKPSGLINHITDVPSDMPDNNSTFLDMTIRYIYTAEQEQIGFINPGQFMSTHWWKNGGWTQMGNNPPADTTYYYFDTQSELWTLDSNSVLNMVRIIRGRKLAESDWTQLDDVPMTAEKKAEWSTYRQQLRDFPSTVPPTCDDPDSLVWPTPPA
jgi:hypothetical protein